MINKTQLLERLQIFLEAQIDSISSSTPVIGLVKPLLTRAIRKKLQSSSNLLDLITDDNGNIDVEGILKDMTVSIASMQSYTFQVPILGNINIGGGKIEIGIPFTDKNIVLNETDLSELSRVLTLKE